MPSLRAKTLLCTLILASVSTGGSSLERIRDLGMLSSAPVVVVGRWTGDIESVSGTPVLRVAVHRTIRGTLEPTEVGIAVDWHSPPSWTVYRKEGLLDLQGHRVGATADLRHPGLWFCRPNGADKGAQLRLVDDEHGIQPLAAEPFFAALCSGNPVRTVFDLLGRPALSPECGELSLAYLIGWHLPWPWDSDRAGLHLEPREGIGPNELATQLCRMVRQDSSPRTKALCLATHALVAKEPDIPLLRECLTDELAAVRLTALAWLVRLGYALQLEEDQVQGALSAANDMPLVAWRYMDMLTHPMPPRDHTIDWDWDSDDDAVPPHERNGLQQPLTAAVRESLLAFLEIDSATGHCARCIPAIRSREILREATGLWLPFDRDAAAEILKGKAEGTIPPEGRQAPDAHRSPITVVASISHRTLFATLVNHGQVAVAVTAQPECCEITWQNRGEPANGYVETSFESPSSASDFVRLAPGEAQKLGWDMPASLATQLREGEHVILELWYPALASRYGMNGWIGLLRCRIPLTR